MRKDTLSRIKNKLLNKLKITSKNEDFGSDILTRRISKFLNLGYEYEKEAFEAIQIVKHNTMLPYEPLVSLFSQVAWIEANRLEGCLVECGVWKGGASGIMALANMKFSTKRRDLHLFDAFDDICQPIDGYDDKKLIDEVKSLTGGMEFGEELQPMKGIYDQFGGAGSILINRSLLETTISYPKEFLHFHKGWFQDTVPKKYLELGKIAILRLDGDWYESTKVCMEYLYPLVISDGIIIIDDYGYNGGCSRAVHEVLERYKHNPYINYVNQSCRYFFKP